MIGFAAKAVLLVATACLTACFHADDPLGGDYVMHDMGGSNRSLIGNGGAVSVLHVSGYSVADNLVMFETDPLPREPGSTCGYGYVDMARNRLQMARAGSSLEAEVKRRLSEAPTEIIASRTCLRG